MFYEWRQARASGGDAALAPRKRGPKKPMPNQFRPELVDKILRLRREFHFGAQRIVWHLRRYEDIKVSITGVAATFRRHGVARLPRGTPIRSLVSWVRYEKTTPGHHVQIDVKFVDLSTPDGTVVRRFQYTAIDDATRIRALRIYDRHSGTSARATLERSPAAPQEVFCGPADSHPGKSPMDPPWAGGNPGCSRRPA